MSNELPALIVNRSFILEFMATDPPCFALGLVEEGGQQSGLLALRPEEAIPPEVTDLGLNFGHSLLGTITFEVIHFSFEFYGFQTYNVLINPHNPLVQKVLAQMIASGDYFFFALHPNHQVTAFRAGLGQELLTGLTANLARIQHSTTSEFQYGRAVTQFAQNPDPAGVLLQWTCRDNLEHLDLTTDRMQLNPV